MDRFCSLLLAIYLTAAAAAKEMACYTCTSTEESSLCEKNPATLIHSVLQSCPRDVCTIVRVEDWPSQKVKLVNIIIIIINLEPTYSSYFANYKSSQVKYTI